MSCSYNKGWVGHILRGFEVAVLDSSDSYRFPALVRLGDMASSENFELAHMMESCAVVRSRFRKGISFLQWPYYVTRDEGKEDDDEVERHPVCTKSVELNADILLCMADHFEGEFAEVLYLQSQA